MNNHVTLYLDIGYTKKTSNEYGIKWKELLVWWVDITVLFPSLGF
jgi:hypothetical protein